MNNELDQNYESWSPFRYEIKCILTCAELGSITGAAERVGITQASLTRLIQKIELQVGFKIFSRSPRGITLTKSGQNFISSMEKMNQFWSSHILAEHGKSNLSSMSIGAHSSIANSLFPKIFKSLFKQYPDTKFEFDFQRSVQITQKVVNAELDIGFVINPIKNADLISKHIRQEYIAVWGHQNSEEDILLYNSEMFLSEKILKLIKNKKLVMINDYEIIANMVATSKVTALLPSTVAERFDLKMLSGKLYTVDLNLIYRRDRFHSKNHREFIMKLFQLVRNM